jgi:hypothetical protein
MELWNTTIAQQPMGRDGDRGSSDVSQQAELPEKLEAKILEESWNLAARQGT